MFKTCLLSAVFMLIPAIAWPGDLSVIEQNIKPGNIVFIGESHHRPESIQLIRQLVESTLKRRQCLVLALEIDDRQQPVIDDVMQGRAPVSAIRIPPVIDHPAMRSMIDGLAKLDTQEDCLKIKAIDTGIDTDVGRDEWMAKKLSELPTDKPILVLLGGLHTLKKVDWTFTRGKPFVAEILVNRGFPVKSYPQEWFPKTCEDGQKRASRYISADDPAALAILNESLISLMNAKAHRSTKDVVDGFVVWECKR